MNRFETLLEALINCFFLNPREIYYKCNKNEILRKPHQFINSSNAERSESREEE